MLQDEASALVEAALSLGASVLTDIGSAIGQALSGGVDLSSLTSLFADSSSSVRDTAAYNTAQAGLVDAQAGLAASVATAQATLPTTALTSAGTATDGMTALTGALGASQQLGQLSAAQAFLGRATTNLQNAST